MTSYVNSYVEKTNLLRALLGDVKNQPIKRLMADVRNVVVQQQRKAEVEIINNARQHTVQLRAQVNNKSIQIKWLYMAAFAGATVFGCAMLPAILLGFVGEASYVLWLNMWAQDRRADPVHHDASLATELVYTRSLPSGKHTKNFSVWAAFKTPKGITDLLLPQISLR